MKKLLLRMLLITAIAMASDLESQAPQHLVVPTAYGSTDAISFNWLAGASRDVRQQTLIGPNHLTAIAGKAIESIEFRRTAGNDTFTGGSTNLTVSLSTSPSTTHEVSSSFSNNIGSPSVQVFNGTVTIPTSPPTAGSTVNWTADNVVRIQFSTPFLYSGGRLCVDITGTPIAGQHADWWMADAEFEDIPGTITDVGGGCGNYANSSFIERHSLIVGGYAHMTAFGTPNGLAIAAVGQLGGPVPLSHLGFTPPGNCNVMLGTFDILMPMLFTPNSAPILSSNGGRADFELKIPNVPGAQGLALATQWFDWTQMATTNAHAWTIASIPNLDMALVEGHPLESVGNVTVHLAHVIRFGYQ